MADVYIPPGSQGTGAPLQNQADFAWFATNIGQTYSQSIFGGINSVNNQNSPYYTPNAQPPVNAG